jgi:hypothetical protein
MLAFLSYGKGGGGGPSRAGKFLPREKKRKHKKILQRNWPRERERERESSGMHFILLSLFTSVGRKCN